MEAVLTGKVLQRGEILLISVELVDVENGWQRWGAQYRRTVEDIFAIEQDIDKVATVRGLVPSEREVDSIMSIGRTP